MRGMSPSHLASAAGANLVTHMSWVQRQVAGMMVREDEQLVLVDSGLPCDTFNVVCRARLACDSVERRVATAIDYFRTVARPFSWWVGPGDLPLNLGDYLQLAGLEAAESEVAMAVDLAELRDTESGPRGLRVERVTTIEQAQEFAQINAANWDPPDPDVIRFYGLAAPALLAGDSPIWLYLGTLDGVPVATAELTVTGDVVGLYAVSTREAFRRRGIGGGMTLQPLLIARHAGCRAAVLQASAEGVSVYARIGFSPVGQFTEYKPPGYTQPF
jgi:hypothetical protein